MKSRLSVFFLSSVLASTIHTMHQEPKPLSLAKILMYTPDQAHILITEIKQSGLDINSKDELERTSLDQLLFHQYSHQSVCDELINAGAKVTQTRYGGANLTSLQSITTFCNGSRFPIKVEQENRWRETLRLLLRHRQSADITSLYALEAAVRSGIIDIAQEIMEHDNISDREVSALIAKLPQKPAAMLTQLQEEHCKKQLPPVPILPLALAVIHPTPEESYRAQD